MTSTYTDLTSTLRVYNRTIAGTNLFSSTWNAYYNVLSNMGSDLLPTSKWLFSTYPFRKEEKKTDFPLVVISNTQIIGQDVDTLDIHKYKLGNTIYIYHTSSENLDLLSEAVKSELKTDKNTLYTYGIMNPKLKASTTTAYDNGGYIVHERMLDYEFDFYEGGYSGI